MQQTKKQDSVEKKYLANPERFADVCNGLIYGRRQKIQAEHLQEVSVEKLELLINQNEQLKIIDYFQDIIRRIAIMKDDNAVYLIAALENQTSVDRFMLLRTMAYDFLNYKEVHDFHPVIGQDGKKYLQPVVTFVLYWGETPWREPCRLHDLILFPDNTIRKLTPDYRFNLIDLSRTDKKFSKRFKTDFSYVLYCLTNREDKNFLKNILKSDSLFNSLEENTKMLIKHVLGMKDEVISKTVGGKTMCKAWDEIVEDLTQKGEEKGREEGREEGRKEGEEKGRKEERNLFVQKIRQLFTAGTITKEQLEAILESSELHLA